MEPLHSVTLTHWFPPRPWYERVSERRILEEETYHKLKRALDVVPCIAALPLVLVVLAICAIAIKLDSPGPVWFAQMRTGKGGRRFRMYKLRTMHTGAEAGTGAVWAGDNDHRIISACRWMRRSHVDELPQLLNVIMGEMSLVGPRPERPEIMVELEKAYPNVRERLAVRPGITGLAQVRNGYDTTIEAFRKKLQADLEYIERRKWSMELRILAATLTKVHDKGAR